MRRLGSAVLALALLGPYAAFAGAMQDAQLINKGQCGRNQSGQSVYVRNSSKRRTVKVVVHDVRSINGVKAGDYRITRIVPAGTDAAAGCTKDMLGDDKIVENNYKIVAATYK